MPEKVEIKKVERVFDGFFKIDKTVFRFEKFDGTMSDDTMRLNFNRGNSVAVLIFDRTSGCFVLTKQFRYPAYSLHEKHGWIIEIMAGMIDKNETPEQAAIRETKEETGITVLPHELKKISEFYVSPGGTSEFIYLYYVEVDLPKDFKPATGDETEDIQVVFLTPNKMAEMIQQNEIVDAKTIIAYKWFENNYLR